MILRYLFIIFLFNSVNIFSQDYSELSNYLYLAEKDNLGSIISININTKKIEPLIIIFPEEHLAGPSRIETTRYILRLHDILNIKDFYLEGYTIEKSHQVDYKWEGNPAWKESFKKQAIINYTNRISQNRDKGILNPIEFVSLVRQNVNVYPIEKDNEFNNIPLNKDEFVELDQFFQNIKDEKIYTQITKYFKDIENYIINNQSSDSASSISSLKQFLSENVEVPQRIIDLLSKFEKFEMSVDNRSRIMASIIVDSLKQKKMLASLLLVQHICN